MGPGFYAHCPNARGKRGGRSKFYVSYTIIFNILAGFSGSYRVLLFRIDLRLVNIKMTVSVFIIFIAQSPRGDWFVDMIIVTNVELPNILWV